MYRSAPITAALVLLAACGQPDDTAQKEKIVEGMHSSLLAEIKKLKVAAEAMKTAAPVTQGRGWDATTDAAAISDLKARWYEARTAYEHIEGAVAPLFGEIDGAIDERYDGFLEGLGATGDQNLFDGEGVTGMHGIERILWSDTTPASVKQKEATLPGNKPAAFPSTEAEAADFKNKLCAQLVTDIGTLEEQWTPAKIDLPGAYQGLKDLMNEQREKVNNASNNLEESRYSQRTMRDLRDNLDGTKAIYALFQPWIITKPKAAGEEHSGKELDDLISQGFDQVAAAYAEVSGDAIPAPPATWSAEAPSAADLQTPFGKLYLKIRDATDPASETSVVHGMDHAGELMFPGTQQQ
ncbi:MAG: EfeM/EfeO family lipoprotein [Archangiaceae bacterium]|nr:EfeM/EfeO family lipoprotein [Archangiaceae bacterium]